MLGISWLAEDSAQLSYSYFMECGPLQKPTEQVDLFQSWLNLQWSTVLQGC